MHRILLFHAQETFVSTYWKFCFLLLKINFPTVGNLFSPNGNRWKFSIFFSFRLRVFSLPSDYTYRNTQNGKQNKPYNRTCPEWRKFFGWHSFAKRMAERKRKKSRWIPTSQELLGCRCRFQTFRCPCFLGRQTATKDQCTKKADCPAAIMEKRHSTNCRSLFAFHFLNSPFPL